MALFRFPNTAIVADVGQRVAVRADDGKFYYVTVQDIVDLAVTGGVSIPSIDDDGTTVTVDADLVVSGALSIAGLPTSDPLEDDAIWVDGVTLKMSTGTP